MFLLVDDSLYSLNPTLVLTHFLIFVINLDVKCKKKYVNVVVLLLLIMFHLFDYVSKPKSREGC